MGNGVAWGVHNSPVQRQMPGAGVGIDVAFYLPTGTNALQKTQPSLRPTHRGIKSLVHLRRPMSTGQATSAGFVSDLHDD